MIGGPLEADQRLAGDPIKGLPVGPVQPAPAQEDDTQKAGWTALDGATGRAQAAQAVQRITDNVRPHTAMTAPASVAPRSALGDRRLREGAVEGPAGHRQRPQSPVRR